MEWNNILHAMKIVFSYINALIHTIEMKYDNIDG